MFPSKLLILALAGSSLAVLATPASARETQEAPQAKGTVQAPSSSTNPVATDVDLRPEIERLGLAIRDQGHRGTCSVFATTFLIEYHAARATGAKGLDFSEEYLNWAKNRASRTNFDGGMFKDIIRGYGRFGIVSASKMPYQPGFDPKDPATPAKSLITSAKESQHYPFRFIKKWDNQKGMSEKELQATLALLQAGRPVATGMWWLREFQVETVEGVALLKEYPRTDNENSDPSKNPMFDGHTIDLVGYHEGKAFPGGGYFIFRNSFGPNFGEKGYGFVSFQYIRDYANDAICIGSPNASEPVMGAAH